MDRENARKIIKEYFKEKYYKSSLFIVNKTRKSNYLLKKNRTRKNK